MSAQKRTTVRGKKTAKKTTKKVAPTSRTSVPKRPTKTTKKVAKKVVKKATKKTTKKTTKVVKKIVKRVVKRPVNALPQSVREARYGGHQNTIPTNPRAPGRLLGRSVALSAMGLGSASFNADAIAISIARIGGMAIMVLGLGLTWNLYNELATTPPTAQSATVLDAQYEDDTPIITIASQQPVEGLTTAVVSATNATNVVLALESSTGEMFVLGNAVAKTDTTWELAFASNVVPNGTYQLHAYVQEIGATTATAHQTELQIRNQQSVVVDAAPTTAATSSATTTLAATTSMPTLVAPTVSVLAPVSAAYVRAIGTATPEQTIEIIMLRDQLVATTSVQANGWWSYVLPTPDTTSRYELYAQAAPDLLSQPLDFDVIAGRLVTAPPRGDTQISNVAGGESARESLLWYLLAAVTTMTVGAVLVLIAHHLHHTRRKTPVALDPVE